MEWDRLEAQFGTGIKSICNGIDSKTLQDGSGAISSKEVLGVMRAMGQNPTEDELLNLVMEVDLDGNGTIEFPEFLEMMKSKAAEVDQESDLREAFKIFDRDRDGYIDMKELKKVNRVYLSGIVDLNLQIWERHIHDIL